MQFLRRILLALFVRPVAKLLIGMHAEGLEHLPNTGPAIIAANHNSHIDTLVLLCLFPTKTLDILRPVAAADHFLANPLSSWFSRNIVGIIPLKRKPVFGEDILAEAKEALDEGQILIVFPEGTRGDPEEMAPFKAGIARLADHCPNAPIIPVYIHGAGRALPKGEMFVPMNVSAYVGEPVFWHENRSLFMDELKSAILTLKAQAPPMHWD
ncbi:MAG: lysophospholipid acyltransferase family protein [Pseudomonadota bacterium]